MKITRATKASTTDQSARFIEAARKIGADETGNAFENAFKNVVKKKPVPRSQGGSSF